MKNKIKSKIVVYKDASWELIEDGITWEFENDENWLVTIPLQTDELLKSVRS